jgi:hypothetical protein
MDMMNLIETGGAVMLTMGVLEVLKRMKYVPAKFIPAIGLFIGMLLCWVGSAAGILPVIGWANIVWYGIMTGLMACGLFSGVKNMRK